jgi:chaperonin GroES
MVRFRPLHDRVLLKRVEADEKTPGAIIIPRHCEGKPIEGEVLAVGPGAPDETGKLRPLDVKVGDRVLFTKWSETEVLIGSEDRVIMKESDISGDLRALDNRRLRRALSASMFRKLDRRQRLGSA